MGAAERYSDAPPMYEWLASQHMNIDPRRAAAARYLAERFGFWEGYSHARALRVLGREKSEHLLGAQLLSDDYASQFQLDAKDRIVKTGLAGPLVPVDVVQCNWEYSSAKRCQRVAIPGAEKCGQHGGAWISEEERENLVSSVMDRLILLTDKAVGTLEGLLDAGSEKVRLEAALGILDRAGVGAAKKIDLNITNEAELEAAEALNRLEALAKEFQSKAELEAIEGEIVDEQHS
jgi:hypothetical protein